jgi:hypothetical protein
MRSVEHATPEDPNALALNVEKRYGLEPPAFSLSGEKIEAGADQFDEAAGGAIDCKYRRQYPIRSGFRGAKEFSEKPTLGEELMTQDLADIARTDMRFVFEIGVVELLPR